MSKKVFFLGAGFSRDFIQSPTTIREILKDACKQAGIKIISPHGFRNFIVHYYFDKVLIPAEIKAIAQKLGHSNVITTFCDYGGQSFIRRSKLIRGLRKYN